MMHRAGVVLALVALTALTACRGEGEITDRGSDTAQWWDQLPRPEWQAFERVAIDDDWFEVYRLADDVYAIYEPGQFEEVISFLVVGQARALLFDTGLGIGDLRSVVHPLVERELVVLNSHGHYDHVGGNYQFDRVIGRRHAYTLEQAKGKQPDAVAEFVSAGWIWKTHPDGFEPAHYRIHPWQISEFVEDREFIDLGGISLEIIATPGHAPDAISLLDSANRRLFTGDTFYPAALYAHLPGSSFTDYAASAELLAALQDQVDVLFTSHNVPTAAPAQLGALHAAFAAIESGDADYSLADGAREYRFDGFSVLTHDPP
jgi:glyoxylase-like metal-dependent hydrolase (beta-lactamase superfamily II)